MYLAYYFHTNSVTPFNKKNQYFYCFFSKIGTLRAFQEASLIVPDQIQIVSFNDTIMARQVFPPLSCVTVYTEEMGRTVMDVLNKQVLTPREIPTLTMLGTKLTLRGKYEVKDNPTDN